MNLLHIKKGEEILYLYLKEINSIHKEYRQNKLSLKGFFDEINVKDFPIVGHQVYLHITRRRWLNEDSEQVVFSPDNYREELSSRRNSGNTGVHDFFKRNHNDCNAIASFYGVSGKNLQHQYKDFLSDFKLYNQKPHAKEWLIFVAPQVLGLTLNPFFCISIEHIKDLSKKTVHNSMFTVFFVLRAGLEPARTLLFTGF